MRAEEKEIERERKEETKVCLEVSAKVGNNNKRRNEYLLTYCFLGADNKRLLPNLPTYLDLFVCLKFSNTL